MFRLVYNIRSKLGPLGWGALIVFIISQGANALFLLQKVVLGAALEPIDFGAVEPIFSALMLATLPVSIICHVAVKSLSRLKELGKFKEMRSLVSDLCLVAFAFSLFLTSLAWIFQDFILSRLALPRDPYLVLILGLFCFRCWEPVCFGIVRGLRAYRLMVLPYVLGPAVSFLLMLVAVISFKMGLAGALAARIVGWSIVPICLLTAIFWRSTQRVSYSSELKTIAKTFIPMTVYIVSTSLFLNFDRLHVRNFLTAESGGYGAVVTLGTMPFLLINPIVFVLFPLASAEHVGGRGLHKYYRQAVGVALSITGLCVIFCALFADNLFSVWNPAFSAYAGFVGVHALTMGLDGTTQAIASIEIARHRYHVLWLMAAMSVLMCVALYKFRTTFDMSEILLLMLVIKAALILLMLSCISRINRQKEPMACHSPLT